jgi:hypothetical protein
MRKYQVSEIGSGKSARIVETDTYGNGTYEKGLEK